MAVPLWPSSPSSVPASAGAVKAPSGLAATILEVATRSPSIFQQLIQQFPEVVNPLKILPAATHGEEHHIITTGPLVSSKLSHLDG
jgi:hypothetical protein